MLLQGPLRCYNDVWKGSLNRQVLRWCRKECRDWEDVTVFGRSFHIRGAVTEKARAPTGDSLTNGTSRRSVLAERSACRPGRSATRTRPKVTRCLVGYKFVSQHSQCGTRNQWRQTRASAVRSSKPRRYINRAAALSTDWRRRCR